MESDIKLQKNRRMVLASSRIKILILLITLLYSYSSFGQKLIESRQTSYYTYIYKISQKEAKKIYKKDIWKVDTSFFHTLVDSFPTDSQYFGKLPQGHYLKTFADKDKQQLSITTVQNFDVFIFNNNTDLCIQVYDLDGNLIDDAKANIRGKKLHFDKNTQSYLDKKSNQKGILQVTYNSFTVYYELSRQYNNSLIHGGTRKILYGTPLKYAWIPVRFTVHLPIDGVKSLVHMWPVGTISRTKHFFVNAFDNIACLFDDYYCNYNTNRKFDNKHTGYIVFNKPKYMPGDTVKFKAFLVKTNGSPIHKEVRVVLENIRKKTVLTKLAAYRDGGYKYEFYLHDSLQLQLDRDYTIRLELNNRKEYISGTFKYEDYELSKTKLSLRVDDKEHFRNKILKLFVKGTDENDLNLLDARIEVLLSPKSINRYFNNQTFIPDTLLFIRQKLNPTDETEIELSDSTFPSANFDYTIGVRLLTSDNESVFKKEIISYYYDSEKFDIDVKTDSLFFKFLKNGKEESRKATIFSSDNFGNRTQIFDGITPCHIELNPYYSSYTIQVDNLSETKLIAEESSMLKCFSERTKDSVIISIDNPRKIPFVYNIYKKNSGVSSGYTDSLTFQKKSNSKQNYFISIRYLWGGKVQEDNYKIPLIDKKLNISVVQPKIVYPGQKTKIDILVTDINGAPVEGVDLTAFSLTKKFDYSAPELPYLGKERKDKRVINNFSFNDLNLNVHSGLKLDYDSWKILAGIDSIEYYKFLYPQNGIYRFEYFSKDSVTQFAPFVVSEGTILPVHVIYVDSKPVYFSWSTNKQPYSFSIRKGFHQVKLRTANKEIIIDSLYFEKGRKLIFSLDQDSDIKGVKMSKAEPRLSNYEKRLLYKYIVPYRNRFGEQYAYLKQHENIQILNSGFNYQRYNNLAGPFVGDLSFEMVDSLTIPFYHEPFFEYEFLPDILKMRSVDLKDYPDYLWMYNANNKLTDIVLTEESIKKQWDDFLDSKRYLTARYRYPNYTNQGAGRLFVNFKRDEKTINEMPLNVLVFKSDNHEFLRVYPGNTSLIHELQEGSYKLIFFYSGAKYHIEDSIFIQPNGLNYYEFEHPDSFKKDTFSLFVSNIIEETLFKSDPFYDEEEKELEQIYHAYQQEFKYVGEGDVVEGYIYDAATGEPLVGTNITIEGTTYGTIADIDGYYSIKVPGVNSSLVFSFLGYSTEQITVGYQSKIDVNLVPCIESLDEVVVVGYGVQKKTLLSGSVSTVSANNNPQGIPGVSGNISQRLQGRVSGVSIKSNTGDQEGGVEIRVRGQASIKLDQSPLYIINGNIFTGDISELDPSIIQNIEILQDVSSTAMYGARAANGVVIIDTEPGAFKVAQTSFQGAEYDETFLEAASQASSIRNKFSDYAFWQPNLITDKEGKASFDVVFPDDVTSWETFYLAMNNKRQSGQSKGIIKSYKPIMAQLALPRFLVQSDTTYAIGKVLNYTPDSMKVESKFEVNGKEMINNVNFCTNSIIDTLTITTGSDSLTVKYYLETEDGYFDGEQRNIPVFPKGLEETKGNFYVLDKDTTLQLTFDTTLGKVNLYARADIVKVIEDEISYLIYYKYSCNEQLASKLKALLAEYKIAYFKGDKFKNDNEIDKLIRLLNKNQKENGLWGWWKDADESLWISLHVLESLTGAEQLGYKINIEKEQITEFLIWELESSVDYFERIRILKILNLLGAQINYQAYIFDLEKTKNISLNGLLNIINLKQLCNLNYDLDTLKYYKKTTLFGNVFYSDDCQSTNLLDNDMQNTLLAYKIFKSDSTIDKEQLLKMRNYFLENRKNGFWRNTYESAQIIETILPDLLKTKSDLSQPALIFRGDINRTVGDFPFEMQVDPNQKIELSKTGDFPIYFTANQRYWNNSPTIKKADFEIYTRFNNGSSTYLTAGQETKLVANVKVKKEAEYIMINIPIPGGCSYAEKKNDFATESHREYFKNETTIFCDYLPKGDYTFEVELIPRYSGVYSMNPAKVELMYFPIFNANTEIKTVKIK